MMVEQNYWIRLSIFIPRQKWHLLIVHCIFPLITELQAKHLITIYILYFNYQQGDNIRLAISAKPNSISVATKIIDESIKSYLKETPVNQVPGNMPISGFFMDMPYHSLHYNMFCRPPEGEFQEIDIRYRISYCLINSITDDPIDYAHLFSFLLYMQASILEAFWQKETSLMDSLKNILISEDESLSAHELESLNLKCNEIYNRNLKILEVIINDVWQNTPSDDLRWLTIWKDSILNYAKKEPDFEIVYRKVSFLIMQQLNSFEINFQYITSKLLFKALTNKTI